MKKDKDYAETYIEESLGASSSQWLVVGGINFGEYRFLDNPRSGCSGDARP
jgi:hypothetical protein